MRPSPSSRMTSRSASGCSASRSRNAVLEAARGAEPEHALRDRARVGRPRPPTVTSRRSSRQRWIAIESADRGDDRPLDVGSERERQAERRERDRELRTATAADLDDLRRAGPAAPRRRSRSPRGPPRAAGRAGSRAAGRRSTVRPVTKSAHVRPRAREPVERAARERRADGEAAEDARRRRSRHPGRRTRGWRPSACARAPRTSARSTTPRRTRAARSRAPARSAAAASPSGSDVVSGGSPAWIAAQLRAAVAGDRAVEKRRDDGEQNTPGRAGAGAVRAGSRPRRAARRGSPPAASGRRGRATSPAR